MLFFVGMAWGFEVDRLDLARALADVRPAVEAETERRLATTPELVIVNRQTLRLEREAARRGAAQAGEPEPQDGGDDDGMLAFYRPWTGQILLIEDAWAETVDDLGVLPAEAHGLLGCLVAHELTHALQDQHGAELHGRTAAEIQASRTMVEGHATLVAGRVCRRVYGDTVADIHGAVSGDALLDASDRDDVSTTYLHGQLYLALQEELHGRDATWAALRSPPPVEEVERALAPILPAKWHHPWELATVDPWPGDARSTRWGGRVTTRLLVAWLDLPSVYGAAATAPMSRAGLASAYAGAAGLEFRTALWMESEAAARAWIATLRASTPTGRSVNVAGFWPVFWAGSAAGGPRGDSLLRLAPRRAPFFSDAWYVHGPVVIGVGALGERASDPARLQRVARTLAASFHADPETDERLATTARLREGTPPRPLPALPPG